MEARLRMLARRSVFEKERDVSFEPVREDQKVGKEIREADGGPRTGCQAPLESPR